VGVALVGGGGVGGGGGVTGPVGSAPVGKEDRHEDRAKEQDHVEGPELALE
jgi:hypothetical protein